MCFAVSDKLWWVSSCSAFKGTPQRPNRKKVVGDKKSVPSSHLPAHSVAAAASSPVFSPPLGSSVTEAIGVSQSPRQKKLLCRDPSGEGVMCSRATLNAYNEYLHLKRRLYHISE